MNNYTKVRISLKFKIATLAGLAAIMFLFGTFSTVYAATAEVWWPAQNVEVTGTQPFKAMVSGMDVTTYKMYWQVDSGTLNEMPDNYQDYPHKEASVDLSGWKWKGTGPYVVNFVAKNASGQVIAEAARTIYTGPKPTTTVTQPTQTTQTTVVPTTSTTAPAPITGTVVTAPSTLPQTTVVQVAPTPSPKVIYGTTSAVRPPTTTTTTPPPAPVTQPVVTQPAPTTSGNILSGKKLYVDPNSQAAAAVRSASPTNATLLKKISESPTAVWLGGWYSDSQTREKVTTVVANAKAQGAVPTFVLYNIPKRDCGSYSAGGANNPEGYRAWINIIADAIGTNGAVVILEPDALPQSNCLSGTDLSTRMSLLSGAVSTLKSKGNIAVYLDAGHSGWKSVDEIATLLKQGGVERADGFSLNVSNYQTTQDSVNYGKQVSAKVNGKHFVVDTSRNGNGSNGEWCNPSGRALGERPSTTTNEPLADAYLWIKAPGESDGQCNGGPSAGTWWTEYALGLATRARW